MRSLDVCASSPSYKNPALAHHHGIGAALSAAEAQILQRHITPIRVDDKPAEPRSVTSYANFNELMARVGWSDAELSRRLSVRPGTVRNRRTSRREVPLNLLEWLRMHAEAIDRLPPLPKDWTRG